MQAFFQPIVFIDFYFKLEPENGIFLVFIITIKHLACAWPAHTKAIIMILRLFFDNLNAAILRTTGFRLVTAQRLFSTQAHSAHTAARNTAGTQGIEHRFGT